jgi:endonuclease/exonuclease/phosphatase (EEP) superfamily protein YafD
LTTATSAYAVTLGVALPAADRVGEGAALTTLLLFLPPLTWVLPLAVLLPLAVCLRARLASGLAGVAILIAGAYFGPQWRLQPRPPAGAVVIGVLTNNAGQGGGASPAAFLARETPDLVALQEMSGDPGQWQRLLPGWGRARVGEFVLLSRYPIEDSGALSESSWEGRPVAARFLVRHPGGGLFALYNVHLPTLREPLAGLRGRRAWFELLLGRADAWRRWQAFGAALAGRVDLATRLAARIRQESLPYLLVGDLNAPDYGVVHRILTSLGTDAWEARGRGFGWTFPGRTRHPLALFGPWLRLDYVIASPGWHPLYCRVEPSRPSQHRAVMARLALDPQP